MARTLSEHGTSQWAETADLERAGYVENGGLTFGHTLTDPYSKQSASNPWRAITYNGDRHILTVAPTRTGKGTTAIIPALMDHQGALLCIDPKGENAIITAEARERFLGQNVHILDPWGIATKTLEREAAQFNPLDLLEPESEDLADDALMIADALVVASGGDSHWSNEARAMIMGFIIHLVTSPNEEGQRTLGRLREILSLDPQGLMALVGDMKENGVELARSAANRFVQKSERELSSVLSTAQQNTHFLESTNVKRSLEKSTFDFADLKNDDAPISVYIVLPADRLNTHGRWLRLVVSMAITAMVRGGNKPKRPALFLLDEFAALGKLAVVEDAYGLMAGFGMQLWAILQDLSQLQDLYDKRWQTFLGNAGVLQVFGTRDIMTAEYVSKIIGYTTIEQVSVATENNRQGGFLTSGDPNYRSMNDKSFGRPLRMPEEIIRMRGTRQILIFPEVQPVDAMKVNYFNNAKYYTLENYQKFRTHPNFLGNSEFYVVDQVTAQQRAEVDAVANRERQNEQNEAAQAEREARTQAQREAVEKAAQKGAEIAGQGIQAASKIGKKLLDEARKRTEKKDD